MERRNMTLTNDHQAVADCGPPSSGGEPPGSGGGGGGSPPGRGSFHRWEKRMLVSIACVVGILAVAVASYVVFALTTFRDSPPLNLAVPTQVPTHFCGATADCRGFYCAVLGTQPQAKVDEATVLSWLTYYSPPGVRSQNVDLMRLYIAHKITTTQAFAAMKDARTC